MTKKQEQKEKHLKMIQENLKLPITDFRIDERQDVEVYFNNKVLGTFSYRILDKDYNPTKIEIGRFKWYDVYVFYKQIIDQLLYNKYGQKINIASYTFRQCIIRDLEGEFIGVEKLAYKSEWIIE